jgi:hypothetical protein
VQANVPVEVPVEVPVGTTTVGTTTVGTTTVGTTTVGTTTGTTTGSGSGLLLPPATVQAMMTFISHHLPRAFMDPKGNVRAAACGVLANVHEEQWTLLVDPHLFFDHILRMAGNTGNAGNIGTTGTAGNTGTPKVTMAGCLGIGRLASLHQFFTNTPLVQRSFTLLCRLLTDPALSQVVGARASWAFANLCDVAGPSNRYVVVVVVVVWGGVSLTLFPLSLLLFSSSPPLLFSSSPLLPPPLQTANTATAPCPNARCRSSGNGTQTAGGEWRL